MRTNREGFLYEKIPPNIMLEKLNDFDYTLDRCAEFWELSRKEMNYNIPLVQNIYRRIDQREDYFLFFHSKPDEPMHMSQAKSISLLAFWVLKYKPIMQSQLIAQNLYLQHKCTINELYAVYIIASLVVEKSIRHDIDKYFQKSVLGNMIYNLMNRDISKEAMIFYMNSLLGKVESLHA